MIAIMNQGKPCLTFEDGSEAIGFGRSLAMVLLETCNYGKTQNMEAISQTIWQIDCLMELAELELKGNK